MPESSSKLSDQKVSFTLLEICPINLAMQLVMEDKFNSEQFESHRKNLPAQLLLIKISHQSQEWILLKTSVQCKELISNLSQLIIQQNKIVRKMERFLINIKQFLPHQNEKYDQMEIDIIQCLNSLSSIKQILKNKEFKNFISYDNLNQRFTYRKFSMFKKSGGRYKQNCCKIGLFTQWKNREVNVQYNGVTYKNQFGQMKQYLPFSHGFQFFFGEQQTKLKLGIVLISNHRRLILQAKNYEDYILFLYLLKKKVMQSPYSGINKFYSFAPVRQSIQSQFYIDGKDYFTAVADGISKAKKFIYITGWMISPQFLLIRGSQLLSLFDLIKQRAKKGVQVNILVYFQSSFLPNDSLYVKQKFESIGPSVKVLRHPKTTLPVLWSHHSKMVIIDKQQAFFGGLDLCYGRYDSNSHQIFPSNCDTLYPGIQYNNCRLKDIDNVRQYTITSINQRQPRLPWHDICQSVKGCIVQDFVHHFVEMWNFASFQNRQVLNSVLISTPTSKQIRQMGDIVTKDSTKEESNQSQFESVLKQNAPNKALTALNNTLNQLKNKGKSGIDFIKSRIMPDQKINLEEIYRKNQHNMGHNSFEDYVQNIRKQVLQLKQGSNLFKQHLSTSQQSSPKIFFDKQNVKNNQKRQKLPTLMKPLSKKKSTLLIKETNVLGRSLEQIAEQRQVDQNYIDCLKKIQIKPEQILLNLDHDIESDEEALPQIWQNKPYSQILKYGSEQCQLLRSVGNWSIGCSKQNTQFSIHIAYLQMISQAKHFIYIQNQFFVSSTQQTPEVKNQICNALFRRIKFAVNRSQQFRVYVMMPLLPAFSGDLEKEQCIFLRTLIEMQYKTIRSLMKQIRDELKVDPLDYLKFMGLRTHGTNKANLDLPPVTQIIYVHSKLMIIDDVTVICGSANINDRSMLGDRDSQIAVITNGKDLTQFTLKDTGSKMIISEKIKKFRIQIWQQHFNMSPTYLSDPTSTQLWNTITISCRKNTQIYRTLFGCYPDNQMKTLKELILIKQKSTLKNYQILSQQICGNSVQYPIQFLQNQVPPSSLTNKQYYIPIQCIV